MPIYLLCPYVQHGMSESLHQMCELLYQMGLSSYIVYMSPKKENDPILYKEEYPMVREAIHIPDRAVILFPEIYSYKMIEERFPIHSPTYLLWWFTVQQGIHYNTMGDNTSNPRIIHLFHGDLVREFVAPFLMDQQECYYLHGYIDTDVFALEQEARGNKENIVAYNPHQDMFTGPLLLPRGYRTLPLVDLTRKELLHTLSSCKAYVDLGPHPGMSRLPREAALLGCVIITNRFGSAAYASDMGIPDTYKVASPKEILSLLPHVWNDYETCFSEQKAYRDSIQLEHFRAQEQIKILVHSILEPRGLLPKCTHPIDVPALFAYKYQNLPSSNKTRDIYGEVSLFLEKLCASCSHITEVGGQETRVFTDIFLHTLLKASSQQPNKPYTYTYVHPKTPCEIGIYANLFTWNPILQYKVLLQDSFQKIPPTEVLFLHTWHVYGQLQRELAALHTQVYRYIILTHTMLDREVSECVRKGEDIDMISEASGFTREEVSQGVGKAIDEFLQTQKHLWKKKIDSPMHHGIVVLERIGLNTSVC